MNDINTIYYNDFGITFQWKQSAGKDFRKIQLVFRDTGLFITQEELILFSYKIQRALARPSMCDECTKEDSCKSHLLQTPLGQLSFAMTFQELSLANDLITGTIFQLRLDNMLENQSIDSNRMQ
tara:strand:+ start:59419 stop:59790 length:372 start_codon:yes stop_codon:yes gene_type:complete